MQFRSSRKLLYSSLVVLLVLVGGSFLLSKISTGKVQVVSAATLQTYTNTKYGYSFQYPSTLQLSSGTGVGTPGIASFPFTAISSTADNVFVHGPLNEGGMMQDNLIFAILVDPATLPHLPYSVTNLKAENISDAVPTDILGYSGFKSENQSGFVDSYYFDTTTGQFRVELLTQDGGQRIFNSFKFL